MSPAVEWVVGYYLSNGNVAVVSDSPRYSSESYAAAEAARRNREKPFLAHVAIRAEGAVYGRV